MVLREWEASAWRDSGYSSKTRRLRGGTQGRASSCRRNFGPAEEEKVLQPSGWLHLNKDVCHQLSRSDHGDYDTKVKNKLVPIQSCVLHSISNLLYYDRRTAYKLLMEKGAVLTSILKTQGSFGYQGVTVTRDMKVSL